VLENPTFSLGLLDMSFAWSLNLLLELNSLPELFRYIYSLSLCVDISIVRCECAVYDKYLPIIVFSVECVLFVLKYY
jgi:hypothetical protein